MKIKKTLALLLCATLLLPTLVGCAEDAFHIHNWEKATCTSPMWCECGETYGDAKGHQYTAATCTEPSKCTRCGKSSGSSLGHMTDSSSNPCTEDQICTRCGVTVRSASGHNFSSASCTMASTCLRCGESKGAPLGHNFADATCESPSQCTRCGRTDGNALGHLYDNDTCIRCGQIDPDTLPVGLNGVYVISSECYEYSENIFIDTYGDVYNGANKYNNTGWNNYSVFSIHNLKKEYKTFCATLVAGNAMGSTNTIEIYVDDVLKHRIDNYNRETGAIDFSVNVEGASKLKIQVLRDYYDSLDIALVNAQLYK